MKWIILLVVYAHHNFQKSCWLCSTHCEKWKKKIRRCRFLSLDCIWLELNFRFQMETFLCKRSISAATISSSLTPAVFPAAALLQHFDFSPFSPSLSLSGYWHAGLWVKSCCEVSGCLIFQCVTHSSFAKRSIGFVFVHSLSHFQSGCRRESSPNLKWNSAVLRISH